MSRSSSPNPEANWFDTLTVKQWEIMKTMMCINEDTRYEELLYTATQDNLWTILFVLANFNFWPISELIDLI